MCQLCSLIAVITSEQCAVAAGGSSMGSSAYQLTLLPAPCHLSTTGLEGAPSGQRSACCSAVCPVVPHGQELSEGFAYLGDPGGRSCRSTRNTGILVWTCPGGLAGGVKIRHRAWFSLGGLAHKNCTSRPRAVCGKEGECVPMGVAPGKQDLALGEGFRATLSSPLLNKGPAASSPGVHL